MEIPQNKVIAREYVEKNYIHKDKIRELILELEDMSISQDIYFDDIRKMLLNLLNEEY